MASNTWSSTTPPEAPESLQAATPDNLPLLVQIALSPTREPIGELLLRPLIVLPDVDRTFGALAGIEGLGNESEDALDTDAAIALVVAPISREQVIVVEKLHSLFGSSGFAVGKNIGATS